MRRRRPREIAFGFDSFLDLVANVVGIILRLILVAWVGARSYKAIVPPPPPPPSGSPTLYPQSTGTLSGAPGGAATATIASAGGTNHDGTPFQPLVYTSGPLTMTFTGGAATFDMFVDAGTAVGNGQQVRLSYDLTGNGSWDRVETYRYFATDPVPGFEHYTQTMGLFGATGTLGNLSNGRVRLEVWSAIGNAPSTLGIGNQSVVRLPFS